MSMSEKAFLWETEALRSLHQPSSESPSGEWLTLREANAETGVSITTLRRWARKERIPSYLEPTDSGSIRMVNADAVRKKAAGDQPPEVGSQPSGRNIESSPQPSPPRSNSLNEVASRPESEGSSEPPTGTMLVPIDAWDKMLMQLGNLHQAGQELAEARERAAKAETEVHFLKERLAEKRERDEGAATPSPAPSPEPEVIPDERAKTPGLTRLMWRAWRTRPKS